MIKINKKNVGDILIQQSTFSGHKNILLIIEVYQKTSILCCKCYNFNYKDFEYISFSRFEDTGLRFYFLKE